MYCSRVIDRNVRCATHAATQYIPPARALANAANAIKHGGDVLLENEMGGICLEQNVECLCKC